MADTDCPVYYHHDVPTSLGEVFERVMARLSRDAAALREDRRLKRLKGRHYHGAHRLKVGSARVAFSFRGRAKGAPPEVWVHLADARREIYSRDALQARAREWAEAEGDPELLACLDYSGWVGKGGVPSAADDEVVVEPLPVLSPEQADFCRVLLPFDSEHHDPNAVVFLGHGPPGSGKTVVAADSASDAWEFLRYEVIVLVPSGKLQREYRDHLRKRAALSEASPADLDPQGEPGLWIYVAHEFFALLAGRSPTPRARLNTWWERLLNAGQLSAWAKKNPEARHPRFLTLLSALWGDPELPPSVAKDALNISDAVHHDMLVDLRADKSRAKFIDSEREKAGIVLWWETAAQAERKIAGLRPGKNLLILADEAQDLVPAQWRSLVRAAHVRRGDGSDTRVALLGDENQRLAPTAFSWTGVKDFVREVQADMTNPPDVVETKLKGSFRMTRRVGQAANSLIELARETSPGGRHVAVASPDELAAGGTVGVLVTSNPASVLQVAGEKLANAGGADARARVNVVGSASLSHVLFDCMKIEDAKGLEFENVVVIGIPPEAKRDYDSLIRAYTAVTRARDRLLCVLSREEWGVVAKVWKDLPQLTEGGLVAELRKHLRSEDAADRVEQIIGLVENMLERAVNSGDPFPVEALDLVVEGLAAGQGLRLLQHFDGTAVEAVTEWEPQVRAGIAGESWSLGRRVAAWVLLGDFGAAAALAGPDPGLGDRLAADLGAASATQMLSFGLRRNGSAVAPFADLVGPALAREVIRLVEGGTVHPAALAGVVTAARFEARALAAVDGELTVLRGLWDEREPPAQHSLAALREGYEAAKRKGSDQLQAVDRLAARVQKINARLAEAE